MENTGERETKEDKEGTEREKGRESQRRERGKNRDEENHIYRS